MHMKLHSAAHHNTTQQVRATGPQHAAPAHVRQFETETSLGLLLLVLHWVHFVGALMSASAAVRNCPAQQAWRSITRAAQLSTALLSCMLE
jgi:hypothetical protein